MAFRALLYVFVLHLTLVNAASFARFVVRDAMNPSAIFQQQNGVAAQQLNAQFTSLTPSDPCKDGSIACVNSAFAQCTGGKWTLTQCSPGLSCYALPLVNSPGTSIVCDTQQDALSRINASGASGGLTGTSGNSTGSTPPGSSITASATSTSAPSTPTTGSTGGQTSHHDNNSDDDDCGDETGSTGSHGDSHGDTGGDDCNDDNTSGDHGQGRGSTNSTDSSGDDCDGDDGKGGTDTNENDADCDDDITSSAPAMTPKASASSTGSGQLYRRQLNFITDAGETTFAVPTQTAEPSATTPIATTNTPPGTVTVTLVSTITVSASGGRADPTGLPSNSAITFPSPFPSGLNTQTPASAFTSTPTASGPLGNTYTTPTASSTTPLGPGGIVFTTK